MFHYSLRVIDEPKMSEIRILNLCHKKSILVVIYRQSLLSSIVSRGQSRLTFNFKEKEDVYFGRSRLILFYNKPLHNGESNRIPCRATSRILMHLHQQPASKLFGPLRRWGGKRKQRIWNIKSCCKMLIGRDGIRNDVITLGTYFSMVVFTLEPK